MATEQQRGFLLLCVPAGVEPTPESMTFVPALAASEEEVEANMQQQQEYKLVGIQPLELLRAQVKMVEDFGSKHGVQL